MQVIELHYKDDKYSPSLTVYCEDKMFCKLVFRVLVK